MQTENITREYIEQLNEVQPYCFESDREEQWFNIGLKYGLDIADSNPKSPWISVEDDLPCNHEELIKTEGYYGKETIYVITINRYGIAEENYMIYRNDRWEWMHGVSNVAWMPIPELPKEQEIKL